MNDPWLLLGDINQILRSENAFQDAINQSGLIELKYSSLWYTLTNNRGRYDVVWEKLDRAFCNEN